jgi:hypothetical protein
MSTRAESFHRRCQGECGKATTSMGAMIEQIWIGKTSEPLRVKNSLLAPRVVIKLLNINMG